MKNIAVMGNSCFRNYKLAWTCSVVE